ncbi:MAG TPA: hypothetical protein VJZ76_01545 [Thermoanaerobaculia bacterium]|nr:hypothetical protein [Thermoanaerobaculia bacterium]
MKSAFLLLFLATTAFAQPFVSAEQSIPVANASPFATRIAPPIALVPDGNGFIAAWSAGTNPSHIYAARLNAAFEPVAIREIEPFLGTAYDAIYPDINAIDGGYALVALERERIDQPRQSAVILRRLSSALEPSAATLVTWTGENGGIARITGGDAHAVSVLVPHGFVYTVDVNGGNSFTKISNSPIDAATVPRGAPLGITAVTYRPPQYTYYPLCGWPCPLTSPHWSVGATVGDFGFGAIYDNEIARPAIGFGGGMYLVTWLSNLNKPPGQISAARIRADGQPLDKLDSPRTLGTFTPGGIYSRTSNASDGQRFLVAWESGGDLAGAVLLPNGLLQNVMLATGPGQERNPLVVAVMPDRFALAYEVQVDYTHRELRFRYVDFVQFRRRAVR